ncbi:hypothetical protein [Streptomyces sp. GS7]|uniref:hypothetical protein n=1 Tax=Streptomyces sp. GS7 TaxID=2692234 RepID=UPI002E2E526D|nr:hypothetical protein [Streptomyces sp. GS7]
MTNAGGPVVPLGFPLPPADAGQVAPETGRLIAEPDPLRSRLPLATVGDDLAG